MKVISNEEPVTRKRDITRYTLPVTSYENMKVILLQDIENIGVKYEIKEVKDGYARNFLIPKKLVKLVNKKSLEWLASQKEAIEKETEADLKISQDMASRLDGTELAIEVKVGDEGQLFESINAVKIAEKLKQLGFEIKKSQVMLQDPIKQIGEFPVRITLDHNLEAEITVVVTAQAGTEEEKV